MGRQGRIWRVLRNLRMGRRRLKRRLGRLRSSWTIEALLPRGTSSCRIGATPADYRSSYDEAFMEPHALHVHHLCSIKEPHLQTQPKLSFCFGAGISHLPLPNDPGAVVWPVLVDFSDLIFLFELPLRAMIDVKNSSCSSSCARASFGQPKTPTRH